MKKIFLILIFVSSGIYTQIAPEWIVNYPLSSNNNIKLILKDPLHNLYILSHSNVDSNNISGGFLLLAKTDLSGTLLWKRFYSRPGLDSGDYPVSMVLDNQNNIYILDASHGYTSGTDLGIVKYNQNGNFLWDYFYTSWGGINSYDSPHAICVDSQNNCFMTGELHSFYYNTDSLVVLKLNSAGNFQWINRYAPIGTWGNSGECIKSDGQSNIYVGGSVNDTTYGYINAVILKYNTFGVLQWNRTYVSPGNNADCFFDFNFDSQGNLIASGAADGIWNYDTSSALIQKYTSSGNLIWTQIYHTLNPGGEIAKQILMDNNDNIFIMGQTSLYPEYPYNSFLLKYNSAGNLLWSKRYGDLINSKTFVFNITFDINQNVMLSGYERKYGRSNLMLLKYAYSDGALLWNYNFNRTGTSNDNALCSFYNANNLFIAGTTGNEFLLMKMIPTGTYSNTFRRNNLFKPILDSQYTFDTIYLNTDLVPPEAYLKSINITIDTLLHGAMGDIEMTIKNGIYEDTIFYRRGATFDNLIGTNLNDSSTQNICSSGLPPFTGYYAPCKPLTRRINMPASGPWILKIYDRRAPETGYLKSWALTLGYEVPIGINTISNNIPQSYNLQQNYPNPFNPETKIRFSLQSGSLIKLTVYDLNGKEIERLANGFYNTGYYELVFEGSKLASGVYFYVLQTEDFTETKKMVLIK